MRLSHSSYREVVLGPGWHKKDLGPLLSEKALNSHNCRREINFALLKKKPFISVVLEPVATSLGMEMQLSATQAIFRYTLSSDTEFFRKLYSAQNLADCLGDPDLSVRISAPSDHREEPIRLNRESFSDKWFTESDVPQTADLEAERKQKELLVYEQASLSKLYCQFLSSQEADEKMEEMLIGYRLRGYAGN